VHANIKKLGSQHNSDRQPRIWEKSIIIMKLDLGIGGYLSGTVNNY